MRQPLTVRYSVNSSPPHRLFSFLKGGVKKEPRSLSKYSVLAAQMEQCKALCVYIIDVATHPLFWYTRDKLRSGLFNTQCCSATPSAAHQNITEKIKHKTDLKFVENLYDN
jgi:hypothetical protein